MITRPDRPNPCRPITRRLGEAADILPTYERVAARFDRERDTSLFERAHLETFWRNAPGLSILDLGCGSGRPIAMWLVDQGAKVTGVDGAAAMMDIFARNVPSARGIRADMRTLDLPGRFDGILAFNSLFHLNAADQRAMFPVLARHAAPGASLLFTSGPDAGEAWGEAGGEPVYHASLSPAEYRKLLEQNGFHAIGFAPNDPDCSGHCIWHARFAP